MPKSRPPYSAEFRRQMVNLVRVGRDPDDLAREFEPSAESIRAWVAQASRKEGGRRKRAKACWRPNVTNSAICAARTSNCACSATFSLEWRPGLHARPEPCVRIFEFMTANQATFPIATMARVLGVSEAGYHAWRKRSPSKKQEADTKLLQRVHTLHVSSRETYKAPRVHAELRARGEKHGRKRIARLMRAAGLVGASRRRAGVTTTRRDREARPAPDLVDRKFAAPGPNLLWVADITFVPTASGFLYPGAERSSAGPWPIIFVPSWWWVRWKWPSASGGRAMSSIIATRAAKVDSTGRRNPRMGVAGPAPLCLTGRSKNGLLQLH